MPQGIAAPGIGTSAQEQSSPQHCQPIVEQKLGKKELECDLEHGAITRTDHRETGFPGGVPMEPHLVIRDGEMPMPSDASDGIRFATSRLKASSCSSATSGASVRPPLSAGEKVPRRVTPFFRYASRMPRRRERPETGRSRRSARRSCNSSYRGIRSKAGGRRVIACPNAETEGITRRTGHALPGDTPEWIEDGVSGFRDDERHDQSDDARPVRVSLRRAVQRLCDGCRAVHHPASSPPGVAVVLRRVKRERLQRQLQSGTEEV